MVLSSTYDAANLEDEGGNKTKTRSSVFYLAYVCSLLITLELYSYFLRICINRSNNFCDNPLSHTTFISWFGNTPTSTGLAELDIRKDFY